MVINCNINLRLLVRNQCYIRKVDFEKCERRTKEYIFCLICDKSRSPRVLPNNLSLKQRILILALPSTCYKKKSYKILKSATFPPYHTAIIETTRHCIITALQRRITHRIISNSPRAGAGLNPLKPSPSRRLAGTRRVIQRARLLHTPGLLIAREVLNTGAHSPRDLFIPWWAHIYEGELVSYLSRAYGYESC